MTTIRKRRAPFSIDPINRHQHEALEILQEECGELIQAASKLKRGGTGFIPQGKTATFKQMFSTEVADVLTLIEECRRLGLIDEDVLAQTLEFKPYKLYDWTCYLGKEPGEK